MSITGNACKLYYNSGNETTPVWVECKRAKDVTSPFEVGEADVSRRESAWRMFIQHLKEVGLEFGYLYKRGTDTVYTAFEDSALNGTAINVSIMDQAIATSGARGIRFWGLVFGFPREEPHEDGVMVNVTVKPTDYEEPAGTLIEPDLITVA